MTKWSQFLYPFKIPLGVFSKKFETQLNADVSREGLKEVLKNKENMSQWSSKNMSKGVRDWFKNKGLIKYK